jgi:hypothetical protein
MDMESLLVSTDDGDPPPAEQVLRQAVQTSLWPVYGECEAGQRCPFCTSREQLSHVLPSGESFTFTVHAVYLPRPRIEISGPQGVQATFGWQAACDSVVGRMCTATLVNDVETY